MSMLKWCACMILCCTMITPPRQLLLSPRVKWTSTMMDFVSWKLLCSSENFRNPHRRHAASPKMQLANHVGCHSPCMVGHPIKFGSRSLPFAHGAKRPQLSNRRRDIYRCRAEVSGAVPATASQAATPSVTGPC